MVEAGEHRFSGAAALSTAALVAALAIAVGLRFWTRSDPWLDEAQTLAIARLPIDQIPAALRADGSPPLYYVLLHGWMQVFGSAAGAARALSGILSLLALPVAWLLGNRLGGRRVATPALLLLAASPFAIRFATETRMYSLVVLLSLLGVLLLLRVLDRPRLGDAAALAFVAGALALTHYWCLYLLVAVGLGLAVMTGIDRRRRQAAAALLAIGTGGLSFLPWIGSFLAQLRDTGTPWSDPLQVTAPGAAVAGWAGGLTEDGRLVPTGLVLAALLVGLGLLALLSGSSGGSQLPVRARLSRLLRTPEGFLGWVVVGSFVLALTVGLVLRSAFAVRHSAPVLPAFLLLAALGLAAVRHPRLRSGLLVAAVALGLVNGAVAVSTQRTQAGEVASTLSAGLAPGDVVVFCPDQLGPAVARLLPQQTMTAVYPTAASAERVDWRDYARRNRNGSPQRFAAQMSARASSGAVWLVSAPDYRTYGTGCEDVAVELRRLRPAADERVTRHRHIFEDSSLTRFGSR